MSDYPEPTRPFEFNVGDQVYHEKRGSEYVIVRDPSKAVKEDTWEPVYGYREKGNPMAPTIYRSQEQMEDGRFTLIEKEDK